MDEAWKLGIRPTGHKEPPPQPLPPQPDPAWMIAMGQLRDQLDAARAAHLADLRKLVFSANHKEVDREKDDIEFKGNFP